MNKKCGTCVFYKNSVCVRYPPTIIQGKETEQASMSGASNKITARFPPVSSVDCCGEWKQKVI